MVKIGSVGRISQQIGVKPPVPAITKSQTELQREAQREFEAEKQEQLSGIDSEIDYYKNEIQKAIQRDDENRDVDVQTFTNQINALTSAKRRLQLQQISPSQVQQTIASERGVIESGQEERKEFRQFKTAAKKEIARRESGIDLPSGKERKLFRTRGGDLINLTSLPTDFFDTTVTRTKTVSAEKLPTKSSKTIFTPEESVFTSPSKEFKYDLFATEKILFKGAKKGYQFVKPGFEFSSDVLQGVFMRPAFTFPNKKSDISEDVLGRESDIIKEIAMKDKTPKSQNMITSILGFTDRPNPIGISEGSISSKVRSVLSLREFRKTIEPAKQTDIQKEKDTLKIQDFEKRFEDVQKRQIDINKIIEQGNKLGGFEDKEISKLEARQKSITQQRENIFGDIIKSDLDISEKDGQFFLSSRALNIDTTSGQVKTLAYQKRTKGKSGVAFAIGGTLASEAAQSFTIGLATGALGITSKVGKVVSFLPRKAQIGAAITFGGLLSGTAGAGAYFGYKQGESKGVGFESGLISGLTPAVRFAGFIGGSKLGTNIFAQTQTTKLSKGKLTKGTSEKEGIKKGEDLYETTQTGKEITKVSGTKIKITSKSKIKLLETSNKATDGTLTIKSKITGLRGSPKKVKTVGLVERRGDTTGFITGTKQGGKYPTRVRQFRATSSKPQYLQENVKKPFQDLKAFDLRFKSTPEKLRISTQAGKTGDFLDSKISQKKFYTDILKTRDVNRLFTKLPGDNVIGKSGVRQIGIIGKSGDFLTVGESRTVSPEYAKLLSAQLKRGGVLVKSVAQPDSQRLYSSLFPIVSSPTTQTAVTTTTQTATNVPTSILKSNVAGQLQGGDLAEILKPEIFSQTSQFTSLGQPFFSPTFVSSIPTTGQFTGGSFKFIQAQEPLIKQTPIQRPVTKTTPGFSQPTAQTPIQLPIQQQIQRQTPIQRTTRPSPTLARPSLFRTPFAAPPFTLDFTPKLRGRRRGFKLFKGFRIRPPRRSPSLFAIGKGIKAFQPFRGERSSIGIRPILIDKRRKKRGKKKKK